MIEDEEPSIFRAGGWGERGKVKSQSQGRRPARGLPKSVRLDRRREAPKSKGVVQPLRLRLLAQATLSANGY